MKKLILLFMIISVVFTAFSQLNIRDVTQASPSYPHVVRMVELGIMSLDTQNRFNGSEYMPRFDIARFGTRMIDYIDGLYKNRIEKLESYINSLQKLNMEIALRDLESSSKDLDERVRGIETWVIDINEIFSLRLSEIEDDVFSLFNVLDPTSEINKDNPIFIDLVKDLNVLVQKTALDELERISEEVSSKLLLFSNRLDNFENRVSDVDSKFDRVVASLNTLIVEQEEKSREELRIYVDRRFEIEKDALQVTLRNIANTETAYLETKFDSEIMKLEDRLANIESRQPSNLQSTIESLESRLFAMEAKLHYIENTLKSEDKDSVVSDREILFIKSDIEELKAFFSSLDREIRRLFDQTDLNRSHIESFNRREQFYIDKINIIQDKFDTLNSELSFQNKKIDNLIFQFTQLDIEKSSGLNAEEVLRIYNRIESIERFMSVYADEIGQLNVYSKSFEDLFNNYQLLNDYISRNEREINQLKTQFSTIDSRISNLSEIINLTGEELEKLGDINKIGINLSNVEKLVEGHNKDINDLFNKFEVLEYGLNRINRRIEEFDINADQITELKESFDNIVNDFISIKKEMDYMIDIDLLKSDVISETSQLLGIQLQLRDERLADIYENLDRMNNLFNITEMRLNEQYELIQKNNNLILNNQRKINELEKEINDIKRPDRFNIWSNIITGLVGVGVGAFITFFILNQGI